ncbi:MAG TPA: S49 family peptidase [Azospirillaceae bacterium]|nr:S49 family peptidase [Azospirillaceae bacterium]
MIPTVFAAAGLAGRPLVLAPRALDALLAMAGNPALRGAYAPDTQAYSVTDGGIAVVPVVGPLVARGSWLSALFGATRYGVLGDALEAAFTDPGVRAVLLEVDSPGGEVGSVGVVAVHVDESAADAQAGLSWTLIQAGAKKTDGNPHQPLSVAAHADIQADVDALYADFVDLVARHRSLTPEAVRATQAAIYRGP